MKFLLLFCSLLMLSVACSSPREEYRENKKEAQEEYEEEMEEIEEDYNEVQKEEAIDYVEDSEEAELKKDKNRVDIKED